MGGAGAVEAWNFRSVAEECDQFEPHDLLVGSAP